jgi:hypothetical protein
LDVKNTADFYNKVAERCSFKQLKQDYVKRDKGGVLFRKGKYEHNKIKIANCIARSSKLYSKGIQR